MTHILAIDEGTTGTHCLVLDAEGRIRGSTYREITQFFPRAGWVEHDPLEILDRTVEAAREAIATAGERPVAIGIANQRETAVVWERDRPRAAPHAIVWQDRRTADTCTALAPHAETIARTTGLTLDPYFSAAKFAWLLESNGWTERARRGEVLLGTIDAWLIWNLTGGTVHATDPTNASRTSLFDIERRAWSAPLCSLFGVPIEALPSVRSSTGDFGRTHATFFGAPIPISGVAGDQQAALVGQGCLRPGEAKNTYGTGAFLLCHAGDRRPETGDGLLTTIACAEDGHPSYALEASIFVAGAAVQWLRDGLGLIADAGETEAIARGIPSTDGVYFVPALTGLGAPHWEPRARGMIVGLTRGTTRAHLVRATLEAMAYGTADILAAMRRRSHAALERPAGRWRRHPQRLADAVSGGRAGHSGRAARRDGDDRARGGRARGIRGPRVAHPQRPVGNGRTHPLRSGDRTGRCRVRMARVGTCDRCRATLGPRDTTTYIPCRTAQLRRVR